MLQFVEVLLRYLNLIFYIQSTFHLTNGYLLSQFLSVLYEQVVLDVDKITT